MSYVVHKFAFSLNNLEREIELPLDVEFLCVREQGWNLALWYRWNQEITAIYRHRFIIAGTGQPCPSRSDMDYVGTGSFDNGSLILHLFHRRLS